MSTQKTLTVLLGAGPGTGAALGHAFAKETGAVALLARRMDSLQALAQEIREKGGVAEPFACDASNPESLTKAFGQIKEKWPDHQLKVAIFSVNNPFVRKPFLELTTKDMQTGLDIAVLGAFHFSQQVIPLLLEAGGGTLLFSGATAALKGGVQMSSFAVPKFGLRCLSQSLAREFQPKDIHVAHVILDGFINTENLTRMFGEIKAPDTRLEPTAIAQEYVNLHRQHRSAWTLELDLRPFSETF
ncbi:BQ5605_C022g09481 [Microbotryum silenes-dioicae]|uniref:BQ5605_C022g09481 protein n=1 Tax=Microbotryum silenes-dioicae TaxID=796604 RepID=A0A2X0MKS6_9BASI|nr:BQ5605_C022g09481 [Microbotryum silenes-dioicae]